MARRVRPILETAAICWDPSAENLKHNLEMVQHSAAKFVANYYPKKGSYHTFSMSSLIENLGWSTLEDRRKEAKLKMAYRILHNEVILEPSHLPKKKSQRPQRHCTQVLVGSENELEEPFCRLQTTKNTFFFSTPALWNRMVTPTQAAAPSLEAFKGHFRKNE